MQRGRIVCDFERSTVITTAAAMPTAIFSLVRQFKGVLSGSEEGKMMMMMTNGSGEKMEDHLAAKITR